MHIATSKWTSLAFVIGSGLILPSIAIVLIGHFMFSQPITYDITWPSLTLLSLTGLGWFMYHLHINDQYPKEQSIWVCLLSYVLCTPWVSWPEVPGFDVPTLESLAVTLSSIFITYYYLNRLIPSRKRLMKGDKPVALKDLYFYSVVRKEFIALHLNDLSIDIGLIKRPGIGAEVTLGDSGDYNFSFSISLLFGGFYVATDFPFLNYSAFKGTHTTGFRLGTEHVRFSLWKDSDGWDDSVWRGMEYFQDWETILKGRSTVNDDGGTYINRFYLPTIAREGYPVEKVWLKVYLTKYETRHKRWPGVKKWHRWSVVSEGDKCLRVPGKGENSWDCDDNFGIDISFGTDRNDEITGARDAAMLAIKDIDASRARRG